MAKVWVKIQPRCRKGIARGAGAKCKRRATGGRGHVGQRGCIHSCAGFNGDKHVHWQRRWRCYALATMMSMAMVDGLRHQ
eukprot:2729313-Alexandrium_andersonii.AAC.1